jgi:hypothetical protein
MSFIRRLKHKGNLKCRNVAGKRFLFTGNNFSQQWSGAGGFVMPTNVASIRLPLSVLNHPASRMAVFI